MKKTFRRAALLVALVTATSGCQKEQFIDFPPMSWEATSSETVVYVVDGAVSTTDIYSDDDWIEFLDRMVALALRGHSVTFWNNSQSGIVNGTKEKVTFSTPDKEQALRWMAEMYDQGYTVSISYDAATGLYTCTAIK